MSDEAQPCPSCGRTHASAHPCNERDPLLGVVLDDKYEVVRVLGEGGMGRVYEARHRGIGRRLAVKLVRGELARTPAMVNRLENEARAAGGLEHENVGAVHDFGRTAEGVPYLVMEYLKGEDCAAVLAREKRLPISRAVELITQTCRGLEVAHAQGIVHRDLKPANIFICKRSDDGDLVKVVDFGVAKLLFGESGSITGTGNPIGTAYYMSPEQARGERDVDERTDIYSLGVILYEMLGGVRPHEGESALRILYHLLHEPVVPLDSVREDLPPGLSTVVHRAMAFEPNNRFASVAELAAALSPFAGDALHSTRNAPADTLVSPPSDAPEIRSATSRAVSSTWHLAAAEALPPARISARAALGAVVAFLAAASAVVWFHPRQVAPGRIPPSSAGGHTTPLPPSAASVQVPVVAGAPPIAVSVMTSARPEPSATGSAVPNVVREKPQKPARRTAPATSSVSPSASPKPDSDCDPNFYFDSHGNKHFKPVCFGVQ